MLVLKTEIGIQSEPLNVRKCLLPICPSTYMICEVSALSALAARWVTQKTPNGPRCRREHNTFFPHVYNTKLLHPSILLISTSTRRVERTHFSPLLPFFHHLHFQNGQRIPEPIRQTRKQRRGRRRSTLCRSKCVRLIYLLLVSPSHVLHLDKILKSYPRRNRLHFKAKSITDADADYAYASAMKKWARCLPKPVS